MRIIFILIALKFSISSAAISQNRIPAFEMNDRLGRGMNMGNSFESPSEGAWGNTWKAEYFKIMADLGFNHVRLPVRWEPSDRSMAGPPYTINPTFLSRIQEVVDEALKNELHIIINMHHHEALYEDPQGQKERFLSMWEQISTHFQDYPDSLLFEVLNEPHGNLSSEDWNVFFEEALSTIRETNPTRVVLLGIAEYGGLGGLSKLEVPDDEYIILTPHYYNPFSFTHQGAEWVENSDPWLGTEWLDTEIDREAVESDFNYAIQFSETEKIPIHVGEFGAYSKADMESREKWTTYLARWFEEQGFSWAYWEFSAGFGIYDPDSEELIDPLVNALLHNEMADPIPVIKTQIYKSDFSSSTDGWTLNTQGGAAGNVTSSDGKLNLTMTNLGTENWHAQIVKNNIRLEKGQIYKVSFKAKAVEDRSASFNIGKASSPWNSYSGYNGFSINTVESSYTYSFTMNEATDPAARMVFDVGQSLAGFEVYDIIIERLKISVTAIGEVKSNIEFEVFPNPFTDELRIFNPGSYQTAILYDLKGNSLQKINIKSGVTSVEMSSLPSGLYLLSLNKNGLIQAMKIVKN